MSGIARLALSFRKSSGSYSVATWRAVDTVDWTTKKSAPASSASFANRIARWGMEETATRPPPFLISVTRRCTSSSLMGSP
jgi:hypothetical protein